MKSIMIVNDEKALEESYNTMIRERHADAFITHAYTVEEALKEVRKLDYTIVLVDLKAEEGVKVLARIEERFPDLPHRAIVVVDSPGEADTIHAGRGDCSTLVRPFEKDDLLHLIDSIMESESQRFVSEHGHENLRRDVRLQTSEKCTIRPVTVETSVCKPTIAEAVDYSESGLRFKYKGRYIPAGFDVSVTIFSLNIDKKKGKIVWSKPSEGGFVSGLRWL